MKPSVPIQAGISLVLMLAGLFFWAAADLALMVPELTGLTALMTVLAVVAVYAEDRGWCRWSLAWVFTLAVFLRLTLLFRSPELSDDLFRYLFDGLMIRDGFNPYAVAPSMAHMAGSEASALVSLINHADLPTIYPPGAQVIFALGAFAGGVTGMKLVFIMMDLLACVLVLGILRRLGLPESRLILYAWHPLPILEIGASGHVDAAAVCLILLAFYLALKAGEKKGAFTAAGFSGACLAWAVLVKWLPLMFFPSLVFLVPGGLRRFFLGGFCLVFILLTVPFWPGVLGGLETLGVYLASWEFAGLGFRLLRELSGSGTLARVILAVSGAGILGLIHVRLIFPRVFGPSSSDSWFRFNDPSPEQVVRVCYASAMVWLLTTPTLHPWYGLYLVCFLPFAGGVSGVALSWAVFLGYRVLIDYRLFGLWAEDNWTPLMIAAAPALTALFFRLFSADSGRTYGNVK